MKGHLLQARIVMRKLRIHGVYTYHTTSRMIECRNLMEDDAIKALLEYCIEMAQEKYDFHLINYQIMDNHLHLLIKTVEGGATISRIMQYIKSQFARRLNKLLKRIGPVWNERFKDSIVEISDNPRQYFFNLIWYFANNPVKAGKIKSPFISYYGGSQAYFDKTFKSNLKLTLHHFFLELGEKFEDCSSLLLSYCSNNSIPVT